MSWQEKLKDKTVAIAGSPHARLWLFILSFLEAFILPIFIEAILIPVVLADKRHSWHHTALITTLASMVGALIGYAIGYWFFGTIGEFVVDKFHMASQMEATREAFRDNSFVAVFTTAITPIPFKIGAWVAGLFQMNIILFLISAAAGRVIRVYSVAYVVHKFGKQMAYMALKYFNMVSLAVLAVLIVYFLLKFSMVYGIM